MGSGFDPPGAHHQNPRSVRIQRALDLGFSRVREPGFAPCALPGLAYDSTSPSISLCEPRTAPVSRLPGPALRPPSSTSVVSTGRSTRFTARCTRSPDQDPSGELSRLTNTTRTPTATPNPAEAVSRASGHDPPAANRSAPAMAPHPALPNKMSAARTSIIPAPFTLQIPISTSLGPAKRGCSDHVLRATPDQERA